MLKSTLRPVVRWTKDRLEDLKRMSPPQHKGDPRFGLSDSQVYPEGDNFDAVLEAGMARKLDGFKIGKDTPIASIGSCFAEEFAKHMNEDGFNYLKAEQDVFNASANWGRVYTIPCLEQIVEYSVDDNFPLLIESSKKGWFDPLRAPETPYFKTREEAEASIRKHRAASRKAFSEAKVLIVTLGQNEAWVDKSTGKAWARIPPKETMEKDRSRFEAREFSLEENEEKLIAAYKKLLAFNPSLSILMTVSPVPAHATFVDPDVITRSFANKCLLRTVADRVARKVPQARYFPSFEMVLAYNPQTFKADNRHVKNETVGRIFGLLKRVVVGA